MTIALSHAPVSSVEIDDAKGAAPVAPGRCTPLVPAGYALISSGPVSEGLRTDPVLCPVPGEVHEVYRDAAGFGYERWVAPSGAVSYEWYRDRGGWSHRCGGRPAMSRWFPDGTLREAAFSVDGSLSRLDGPARIVRELDGSVTRWWFVGSAWMQADRETLSDVLAGLTPDRAAREVECSVFASLLGEGVSVAEVLAAVSIGIRTTEGVQVFLDGAPAEWILAFEAGVTR